MSGSSFSSMQLSETQKRALSYFLDTNEILLAKENAQTTKDYYDAKTKPLPVYVKYSGPSRGKALFANRDFKPDEVIFKETPWISLQDRESRHIAHVCAVCYRPLGSLLTQLEHILHRELTDEEIASVESVQKDMEVDTVFGELHACSCGDEAYCSTACKGRAWTEYHQLLCPAVNPHIAEFTAHATSTNEIFLLALKTYAKIALLRSADSTLESALYPLRMFVKDYWWTILQPEPSDPDYEPPVDFQGALETVLAESLELLKMVLKNEEHRLEPILSVDFYACLIGLFERNNLGVEVENPVARCLDSLSEELRKEVLEAIRKVVIGECEDDECECCDHEHGHGEVDNNQGSSSTSQSTHDETDRDEVEHSGNDEDSILRTHLHPDCTTLHPIQATINHSCSPNATIQYKPLYTIVRALRDIEAGEEILTSYLDDDEIGEERHRALREYGIPPCDLSCSKCHPDEEGVGDSLGKAIGKVRLE